MGRRIAVMYIAVIYRRRGHELFCVCVHVEASGQKVPNSELAGLSRVVDSIVSCPLPMSCQGGSASLLRVLSDNRVDGRQFVLGQEFSEEAFLQCFREAHQEVFGMLEVTSMVDFLVLRLRGALQEPWMEDVTVVRRCVVAGRVPFANLCGFVTELILVWKFVKEYVRHTGARHLKSSTDRVSFCVFCCILPSFCFSFGVFWGWQSWVILIVRFEVVAFVSDARCGLAGVLREYECVPTGSAQTCPRTL